jgi:hypothetical protein
MEYTEFIKEAHERQKTKVCKRCNEAKPYSDYVKRTDSKDGLNPWCKPCKEYARYNQGVSSCPFKRWWSSKQGRASSSKNNIYSKTVRGWVWDIEPWDVPGVKTEFSKGVRKYYKGKRIWITTDYPKVCPIFGIELHWGRCGMGGIDSSPTLDRINPKLGYVKGNVMIISMLANKIKNNATPKQLKQFGRWCLFGNR